jgi:hypothetical protein
MCPTPRGGYMPVGRAVASSFGARDRASRMFSSAPRMRLGTTW